jgi:hypothetical protein
MNRARMAMSSGVIALGMLAALSPSTVVAGEAGDAHGAHAQTLHATAPLGGLQICVPPLIVINCTPQGSSTTELPSGALLAVGLVPPLALGWMWRRRRRH